MEKIKGEYYISDNDETTAFLVSYHIKSVGVNVLVNIYQIDVYESVSCGTELEVFDSELDSYCEIDVWGKYFFPKWIKDQYQWYHDFIGKGKADPIKSMHDVMQYALKRALEIGNITLF
ncbi:hypothetical protein [Flavobacterium sp. NRK1]|uniref:hypothetical protein n=1 Tax=Flavobacterium sp. NRK1 TaxID=2954929 RepID=UPI002092F783|nr:hypothetical protein [Flavobacterium sp. NRK1]MCO6149077.1 hypothetical protein [Flavobacterium sp. NRK1]